MIDAISSYINGCETDRLSILDYDAYEDSGINWRVRRGYGALMAAYGAPLPLAFNREVTLIDHSVKRLRIETSQGTLSADKAIITVPTNLIAEGAICFYSGAAGEARCRHQPAARPRRQGGAGARRCGRTAGRRQPARHDHARRNGNVSSAGRSASPASKASSADGLRKRSKTPVTAPSPHRRSTRSCRSSAVTFAAS